MKNYYIEIKVSYTDNSEAEPIKGTETFEYIIEAKNKKEANSDVYAHMEKHPIDIEAWIKKVKAERGDSVENPLLIKGKIAH